MASGRICVGGVLLAFVASASALGCGLLSADSRTGSVDVSWLEGDATAAIKGYVATTPALCLSPDDVYLAKVYLREGPYIYVQVLQGYRGIRVDDGYLRLKVHGTTGEVVKVINNTFRAIAPSTSVEPSVPWEDARAAAVRALPCPVREAGEEEGELPSNRGLILYFPPGEQTPRLVWDVFLRGLTTDGRFYVDAHTAGILWQFIGRI